MLVSKALVRAVDVSRAIAPIDFALVTNGAHWIIDEPQLSPQATTTMRQLAGLVARIGTAEPFGLTCLSATSPGELLSTPDNPATEKPIQIPDLERSEALAIRLAGLRAVRRLPADPGDYQAIAAAVLERHRPGALTLVVTNTVDAAQRLYRQLRADAGDCTLLHSRFRGIERAERLAAVIGEPGEPASRIVVTTQVAEAGLDLDAALLVTEAAPWPSLIQRAGRCNRSGQRNADAEVWWVPPPDPFPYQPQDIDASVRELDRLEGDRLTTEDLLARHVPAATGSSPCSVAPTSPPSSTPRPIRPAATSTSPRTSATPKTWTSRSPGRLDAGRGRRPGPGDQGPSDRVPLPCPGRRRVALARDRAVWRFDRPAAGWTRLAQQPPSRPGPGEVLLVNAADGGYDAETGFDPSAPGPVPDSPELLTPEEWEERVALAATGRRAPGARRALTAEARSRRGRPRRGRAPALAIARRTQRAGPRPGRRAARRPRPEHPARGRPQRHHRRRPARPRQGARDLAGRDLRPSR